MGEHIESAKRIREAILKSGLSQQEVADRAKISKQSVSQYLNGVHIPGNQKAGALGEVLGVRPQWLMCLDDIQYEKDYVDKDQELIKLMSRLDAYQKELIKNLMEDMIKGKK